MEEKLINYSNLINNEKKDSFNKFYTLLKEYNSRYNLTTILEEKDVFIKHFLDSSLGEFLFKKDAKVLEVGSGAGFPSLVLKILRPDLKFVLLESIGKKCEFLNVVIKELSMQNMLVLNSRAEDVAKDKSYREQFDVVTARAVARLNTLSEYCLPFVKKGGLFVAYKGSDETEINEAKNAVKILGGKIKAVHPFELPENYGARNIVEIEKISSTPATYPRGNGKERKKPL